MGGAARQFFGEVENLPPFQCRTRLCGWCNLNIRCRCSTRLFQCRTRLCVWCNQKYCPTCKAEGKFQCRTWLFPFAPTTASRSPSPLAQGRLFIYGMSASRPDTRDAGCCKVPSQREGLRYFSFPRRCGGSGERSEPIGALTPHAALWVVQLRRIYHENQQFFVSMPHAALWVVQLWNEYLEENHYEVSMPHAALWVVQRIFAVKSKYGKICFNAARGFVGGAARNGRRQARPWPQVSMPHAALWVVQRFFSRAA